MHAPLALVPHGGVLQWGRLSVAVHCQDEDDQHQQNDGHNHGSRDHQMLRTQLNRQSGRTGVDAEMQNVGTDIGLELRADFEGPRSRGHA